MIRRRTSGITSGGASARDAGAGGHQQAVDSAERTRDAGAGEGGEPLGGGAGAIEAQHLVGEPLDEIAAGRVGDEAPEALPAGGAPPG